MIGGALGMGVGSVIRREQWEIIPNRGAGGLTLNPLIDLQAGRDGRPAAVLGAGFRF